jgi:serine/threonine protein kinase
MNESKILQKMNHPNIVHLYELRDDGNYIYPDGSSKKYTNFYNRVLFAVIQLAQGGEVFDYLANTGRFSEPVARFYFRQLIEALDHCHSQGFAHRDLKPENLLFDDQFNLLLADFGFAVAMAGRDGSGKLRTILGTDNYMAPEIHSKAPYIGSSVDLFAAGIVLFIFYTGHPPFNHAKATDAYYNLICMNNHEKFWNYHARKKPNGLNFFSPQFMSLINAMLAFDPTQRLSIAEIKAHPWYNGEVPTHEEILAEFTQRKAKVDAENDKKKKEIEAKKAQARNQTQNVAFNGVPVKFRDIMLVKQDSQSVLQGNDLKIAEQLKSLKLERQPPVYLPTGSKFMTNHYSILKPAVLLKTLTLVCNKIYENAELNLDDFVVTTTAQGKDDNVTIEMKVFLDGDCSMVEFRKKNGSIFEYQPALENIKKQLDNLEEDSTPDLEF